MKVTAVQVERAFEEWVRDFQRCAKEQGEDGVVDFNGVDPAKWARDTTPYFWALLQRQAGA